MNPVVFVLPGMLLTFVMGIEIWAITTPYRQLDSPEAWATIEHHDQTPKMQAIVKFWGTQLTEMHPDLSAMPVERMLSFLLGRHIFLHGDYPWRLHSRGMWSRLINASLVLSQLELSDVPPNVRMRIMPARVHVDIAGSGSDIWQAPKPVPQSHACENSAQPQTDATSEPTAA